MLGQPNTPQPPQALAPGVAAPPAVAHIAGRDPGAAWLPGLVDCLPGDLAASVAGAGLRICIARDADHAAPALQFVDQRYRQLGYFDSAAHRGAAVCERVTLLALRERHLVGTLSLGRDAGAGLVAGDQYPREIDGLRARGATIGEITKLAIDTRASTRRLLAALFNVGYIYLRRIWGCSDLVIEVTPEHAAFYEHSLNFHRIGAPRLCPRVNVEGVLLRLDLLQTQRTLAQLAGSADPRRRNRCLYTYFLPAVEEARVHARLQREC